MRFQIDRPNKDSIFGEVVGSHISKKLLVLFHGFKGFYSWGFFPEIKKRFVAHGFAVVSFNFSKNGVYRHQNEITQFKTFSENNFSIEQDDIDYLFKFIQSDTFPVKYKYIYGLGHSRGGGALLLAALRHPKFFKKIVTWASIASILDRISEKEKAIFLKLGFCEVVNGRTGDVLRVGAQFQHDLEAHREAFDIIKRIHTLAPPLCIIHGDADETVPVSDAYQLYQNASRLCQLHIIKRASHTFNYDKHYPISTALNEALIRSLYFLEAMDESLSN